MIERERASARTELTMPSEGRIRYKRMRFETDQPCAMPQASAADAPKR